MAFQYPSYAIPKGYDGQGNIGERFKSGFDATRGLVNEADAAATLAKYADSLYGQKPGAPAGPQMLSDLASSGNPQDRMIGAEHTAAANAADPTLVSYFKNLAGAESGGDPNAKNPNSSAGGLYQITDPTWQALVAQNPGSGLTPDGKMDPQQQQVAVRLLTQQNAGALKTAGQPVNPATLYAAHFLGAPAATQVLGYADTTPMTAAVPPEVLQANPNLQNMTVGDFKQWAGQQGGNGSGGYQPPREPQAAPGATGASGNGLPPREVLQQLFANPETRGFAVELVKQAQTGAKPIEVNGQLVDPNTHQILGDYRTPKTDTSAATDDTVNNLVDGIMNGNLPPDTKGLYKLSGPVKAELAKRGYDYTKASMDYTATGKLLSTLNGPGQVRLRQAVNQVSDTLPLIEGLAQQWKGGKFPLLNKANIALAKQGAYGPDAQSLATQLDGEIADVAAELATVYRGGNTATDSALEQANKQFSADWSESTLLNAIQLAKVNVAYRKNSLNLATGGIDNSAYNPMSETPAEQPSVGPAGITNANPMAAQPPAPPPPASYDGDPAIWQHMTPEERKLWQ